MSKSKTFYDRVKIARSSKRPTGLDYIRCIFKGFTELHGDRCYADDAAIVGGIAWLEEMPVTVIALEKDTAQKREVKEISEHRIRKDTAKLFV